jgi:hypothetical protein
LAGCPPDRQKPATAADAATPTAGAPAEVDAGAAPVVVDVPQLVDPPPPRAPASIEPPSAPAVEPVEARPTVFDRVLVKTTSPMEPAAVQELIERLTGARIREARKGPFEYTVVVFVPTTPIRDRAAQQALVERIRGLDGVAVAEGDRMMRAR